MGIGGHGLLSNLFEFWDCGLETEPNLGTQSKLRGFAGSTVTTTSSFKDTLMSSNTMVLDNARSGIDEVVHKQKELGEQFLVVLQKDRERTDTLVKIL